MVELVEVAATNQPLPIEKLRVEGSHMISPSPRQSNNFMVHSNQNILAPPCSAISVSPETQLQIDKQPNLLRRYEFIRRTMTGRTENPASPTFVIEGKRVDSREYLKQGEMKPNYMSGKISPMDFLSNESALLEVITPILPPKPKSEEPQISKTSVSVALPVLRINGPGCSQQVGICGKSLSLPDTSPEHNQLFVGGATSEIIEADAETKANGNVGGAESIWSEILADQESRYPRAVKKNNFFQPVGTRLPETDHMDLCIENCRPNGSSNSQNQPQATNQNAAKKTINLQLQHHNQPKLVVPSRYDSRAISRDRLSRKPFFHSINSYLHFNKSRPPTTNASQRALYGSEPIFASLDSDCFADHNVLKPLDIHNRASLNVKKLVAKHSDMAIQSDLHDFFRIKAVK